MREGPFLPSGTRVRPPTEGRSGICSTLQWTQPSERSSGLPLKEGEFLFARGTIKETNLSCPFAAHRALRKKKHFKKQIRTRACRSLNPVPNWLMGSRISFAARATLFPAGSKRPRNFHACRGYKRETYSPIEKPRYRKLGLGFKPTDRPAAQS